MTWAKRRAIVIGLLILFVALILWAARKPAQLAANSVLVIDAEGNIEEQRGPDFLGAPGNPDGGGVEF